MVVDIGGGTTEVAVMSMSGVVASRSLRVAGDEMDQDVVQYLRNKYNLLIGEGIAEQVKWQIGSAYPLQPEKTIEIRGRNLVTGLPETVEVSSIEIREALSGSVQVIIDTVRDALDELSEREREVVNLRYGLHGGKAHTLQELGAHFKVSRERVRQIEGQALRKLRKGGLSQAVRNG